MGMSAGTARHTTDEMHLPMTGLSLLGGTSLGDVNQGHF